MRHKEYKRIREREHRSGLSVGLFFILLGVVLLIATNDLLHLGGVNKYFTWETAMIFIGILLLLNLKFAGGFVLIACGVWFLQDNYFIFPNEYFSTYYWPAVIGVTGLGFILSSLVRRKNR
ncbi:MAG TPA: DUF5668 domain-containing protein [Bacteroidales bacterium]|nr:DUF5668 domain-containing protein [Bacteroidales bacterium]